MQRGRREWMWQKRKRKKEREGERYIRDREERICNESGVSGRECENSLAGGGERRTGRWNSG